MAMRSSMLVIQVQTVMPGRSVSRLKLQRWKLIIGQKCSMNRLRKITVQLHQNPNDDEAALQAALKVVTLRRQGSVDGSQGTRTYGKKAMASASKEPAHSVRADSEV